MEDEIGFDDSERKPQGKAYRTVNGQTTRVCDECGADMVVRKNRSTGEPFLGCSRWPDCDFTEPLPISMQLKALGIKGLPGFE